MEVSTIYYLNNNTIMMFYLCFQFNFRKSKPNNWIYCILQEECWKCKCMKISTGNVSGK